MRLRQSLKISTLTSEHSIITDAAVRRFQCQRAYLRANAGLRWMNSRNSILRGQKPNASHLGLLQQADATLRNVDRPPDPRLQRAEKLIQRTH
ncbi:hypothetical protein IAQ61_003198 [Plenodomus lingam]|uniref:uncharacterized protein n=1 Tax=Leptosphaeria maculans TaxID=5022 RepID=UPI003333B2D8|nr:hypothetical protein IAQ61_003198 [Plenodomus lingam]